MRLLRIGSTGDDVRQLQRLLTEAGYPTIVDGVFGPKTKASVLRFQEARELPITGEADEATLDALGADVLLADVSYLGGVPDYKALRARGVRGVIVRLGTGVASVDSLAERQIAAAQAADVSVEAGYFYVQSARDGAAQADHAAELAARFGLPIFPDLEPARQKADDVWPVPTDAPHLYAPVAAAHLERLRDLGVRFGVYGGDFLASLHLPEWVGELPFWSAAYGPRPHLPAPFKRVTIWQYAGNKPVLPKGAVVDFNLAIGGMVALRKALGGE